MRQSGNWRQSTVQLEGGGFIWDGEGGSTQSTIVIEGMHFHKMLMQGINNHSCIHYISKKFLCSGESGELGALGA